MPIGRWLIVACLASLAAVCHSPARAGGLTLYEIGSNDVGLASAGYAARAQDAATLYTNPAGMTHLQGSQLMVGAQALYGNVAFSPGADTTVAGGDGGNALGWLPGGSLFYAHRHSDRLRYGVGIFGNFGLSLKYDQNWVGRYYLKEATLMGLSFMPAVAYRINDKLSVGAGLNLMYGIFSNKVAVRNLAPGLGDGQLEVNDRVWGTGANLGILFEPGKATRLGLTYSSEIGLDFKDRAGFSGLGPLMKAALSRRGLLDAELGLDMKVPQMLMFSAFHQIDSRWAVMGDIGWQQWSRFGKVGVEVDSADPTSLTVDRHYKDTWHAALGLQYQVSAPWRLSCGLAFDSAMLGDAERTPDMPNGETWRLGLGGRYAINQALALGLGYTFIWMGDLSMDVNRGPLAGRVAGEYQDTAIHVLAVNLNWTF